MTFSSQTLATSCRAPILESSQHHIAQNHPRNRRDSCSTQQNNVRNAKPAFAYGQEGYECHDNKIKCRQSNRREKHPVKFPSVSVFPSQDEYRHADQQTHNYWKQCDVCLARQRIKCPLCGFSYLLLKLHPQIQNKSDGQCPDEIIQKPFQNRLPPLSSCY